MPWMRAKYYQFSKISKKIVFHLSEKTTSNEIQKCISLCFIYYDMNISRSWVKYRHNIVKILPFCLKKCFPLKQNNPSEYTLMKSDKNILNLRTVILKF